MANIAAITAAAGFGDIDTSNSDYGMVSVPEGSARGINRMLSLNFPGSLKYRRVPPKPARISGGRQNAQIEVLAKFAKV